MEAILLIGIQGSGKTTFYRDHFSQTHARISLDLLKTRRREKETMQACLQSGQPFVIDNTNVRRAERQAYIDSAKSAGFRVIGYFFDTPLGEAIRRNKLRSGREVIPVAGIAGTLKRLERPSIDEGFDELHTVSCDQREAGVSK